LGEREIEGYDGMGWNEFHSTPFCANPNNET